MMKRHEWSVFRNKNTSVLKRYKNVYILANN